MYWCGFGGVGGDYDVVVGYVLVKGCCYVVYFGDDGVVGYCCYGYWYDVDVVCFVGW